MLAAAAVTGFAAYERSNMSDLMKANVEALANDEYIEFSCPPDGWGCWNGYLYYENHKESE